MPTLPSREALRAAYDAAVSEIDSSREKPMLTTAFYAGVGDSVFDACYLAIGDYCEAQGPREQDRPPNVHVVSAPAGAGKTSFSLAFITALVRHHECDPNAPYGCVLVVDQITKAEDMYNELVRLLPGKVAIWSTDHDKGPRSQKQKEQAKVQTPSKHFYQDDLRLYPVAIVTHAFYGGSRGHKARNVWPNGKCVERSLTIVDEQPNQVEIHSVMHSQAVAVREGVLDDPDTPDDVRRHVEALVSFMSDRSSAVGDLEKPTDAPEAWAAADDLTWFRTDAAQDFARAKQLHIPGISEVFAFGRCLSENYAFLARSRGGTGATQFIGYRSKLMRTHGMVLLDATADIDGLVQLCPWRVMQPVPQARYENLTIVHVPSVTRERTSAYLKLAKNRRIFVEHVESVIKQNIEPGQRGLVVCHKTLFDNENVPASPPGLTDPYTWNVDGRLVATTHWGLGIGANRWKDADVVFLFEEFYLPRRTAIANAQGLQEHKATQGALASMTTQNSRAEAVDLVWEGHLLRWGKQMALRGRGRCYDEHGVCGNQKLVCTGNLERLLVNKDRLFPGANVVITTNEGSKQRDAEKLYAVLTREGLPSEISTAWVGQQLGKPWREVGKNVMRKPSVQTAIANLGFQYVPKPGRGGGSFVRINEAA